MARGQRWGHQRQLDPKRRAASGPERNRDAAAVLFDDAPAERQPQAGSLARRLRREERFENLPLDVRRDAGAGIRDGQLEPRPGRIQSGRDLDPAAGGQPAHRLVGIGDEVQEHLVELMGVGPERR